jgi:phage gp36-like protein
MRKLYVYVDESGQDPKSEIFVVVAVVSDKDQDMLRKQLLEIERFAGTGKRKWHKSRPDRRFKYLQSVLEKKVGKGEVYFGRYKKPLPYFLPVLETIECSITAKVQKDYRATVYIDGIDKKKAVELTNALRLRGIRLGLVRSRRDESEPLIRLADMWAGCIRGASLGKKKEKDFLLKAKKKQCLIDVQENKISRLSQCLP